MVILYVDDDPLLVRVCANLLRAAGHRVLTAGSASAGLRRLELEPIELLISDFELGSGPNGAWLLEQAARRWPAVRRILATGSLAAARGALTVTVDTTLEKPFGGAQLLAAIAQVTASS